MSPVSKKLLPLLAVLSVAWAQIFGLQRGFECGHNGVVPTSAEHCHRVELDGHVDFAPCASAAGKDCGDKDAEHHVPVVNELRARTFASVAISTPATTAIKMAEQFFGVGLMVRGAGVQHLDRTLRDTGEARPPAALQVVQCVVMLV